MLQVLYRLPCALQLLAHLSKPSGIAHISNSVIRSNHL